MKKSQLRAISYAYSEKRKNEALQILKANNKLDDFKKSKYKTPTGYVNFLKRTNQIK